MAEVSDRNSPQRQTAASKRESKTWTILWAFWAGYGSHALVVDHWFVGIVFCSMAVPVFLYDLGLRLRVV